MPEMDPALDFVVRFGGSAVAVLCAIVLCFRFYWVRVVVLGYLLFSLGELVIMAGFSTPTILDMDFAPLIVDPEHADVTGSEMTAAFGLLYLLLLAGFGVAAWATWRWFRRNKANGTLIRPWNAR
jgi:hypothetical protein